MIRVTVINKDEALGTDPDSIGGFVPHGFVGVFDLVALPNPGDYFEVSGWPLIVNEIMHTVENGRHEIEIRVASHRPARYWFYLEWSPEIKQPPFPLGIRVRHDAIPRVSDVIVVENYHTRPIDRRILGSVEVVSVLHYIISPDLSEEDEEDEDEDEGLNLAHPRFNLGTPTVCSSEDMRVFVRPVKGNPDLDVYRVMQN
jgi:hypothetical protein